MLHALDSMILETSAIWQAIINERRRFYSKRLDSFVNYARKQASMYGIKGSRLQAAKASLPPNPPHLDIEQFNRIFRKILK